jgi:hypothetical protein
VEALPERILAVAAEAVVDNALATWGSLDRVATTDEIAERN